MKKVVFFTEFSYSIGYGHISRCSALADEFVCRGFEIEFIIRGSDSNPKLKHNHILYNWDEALPLGNVNLENCFFVFDTYKVPKSKLNDLAEKIKYPISISDSKQNFIEKGLVIFASAYGHEIVNQLDYGRFDCLAGPKYVMFRSEFLKRIPSKKIAEKNIKSIVISLGAFSDVNVLSSILRAIKKELYDARIIVLGKVSATEVLREIPGINFQNFVDVESYINLLQQADVAILNGGQSLNEALLLRVPSIAIPIVENQRKNIQYWSEKNACFAYDFTSTAKFENNFESLLKEMQEIKTREKLITQKVELDGLGAQRIVDFLTHKNNQICNLK